jgi:seryl-tRNA synthetase
MLDIQWIRQNPAAFDAALARRKMPPQSSVLLQLDAARREGLTRQQELQKKRNDLAKAIGQAKAKKEDAEDLLSQAKQVNEALATLEASLGEGGELTQALARLPNILSDAVPDGSDEAANQELRRWGSAPVIAAPKEHDALGENLGQMDFAQAAKISGSRFVFLKGQLARLERALASFMLDMHTNEYSYTEVIPPFLVRDNALFGTGQLPKFAEDLFQTTSGHWLIPTSEVSLTNLVADKILSDKELPLRFTAYTPCFRSEAGSAGRDTKGMIRQHQFSKVELVSITTPEASQAEHERMTAIAEEVLKRLGLHYRVMLLCSGDTGFGATRTHDLEVWLPGQGAFREISSVSNCGDFQARRMKARFKQEGEKDTRFVHTLNGSALAVGRTMVAILENYQQADGSIAVPEVLVGYMGGMTKIVRE